MARRKGRARTNPNPATSNPDVEIISLPNPIIIAILATPVIQLFMSSFSIVRAACIFIAIIVIMKLSYRIFFAAVEFWDYNEMWEQHSRRRKELRGPKKPRISRTLNARIRRDRNKTV